MHLTNTKEIEMRKNRFQVVESAIGNADGSEKRAWNVVDTDGFVVDVFTVKADAKYFASKWSKQG